MKNLLKRELLLFTKYNVCFTGENKQFLEINLDMNPFPMASAYCAYGHWPVPTVPMAYSLWTNSQIHITLGKIHIIYILKYWFSNHFPSPGHIYYLCRPKADIPEQRYRDYISLLPKIIFHPEVHWKLPPFDSMCPPFNLI